MVLLRKDVLKVTANQTRPHSEKGLPNAVLTVCRKSLAKARLFRQTERLTEVSRSNILNLIYFIKKTDPDTFTDIASDEI